MGKPQRDWRFNGRLETYKERVGTEGLAEYAALLERLQTRGQKLQWWWSDTIGPSYWPDKP